MVVLFPLTKYLNAVKIFSRRSVGLNRVDQGYEYAE